MSDRQFVCSTCGDEWADGRDECALCGNGRRTVYYSEAAQLATFTIMSCSICRALVSEGDTREHGEWHMAHPETARKESFSRPTCCGQPCDWAERAGVWVCHYREHHCYNDAGESVDDDGRTEWERQIHRARQVNPSRLLG